ncbi:MAG: polysaccharide lyase [Betaproteobacteria bacterium]
MSGPERFRARSLCAAVAAFFCALAPLGASAEPATLSDGADGATCDYFNLGAHLQWRHRQGDWKDAGDTAQGERPFAQALVNASDTNRVVTWDVTRLVQGWLAGKYANGGIVIARVKGQPAEAALFHSREAAIIGARPRLVLTLQNGAVQRVPPLADTTLDCTTFTSLGTRPTLTAGAAHNVTMQFDLSAFNAARVDAATLELVTTEKQYGNTALGVFRMDPPLSEPTAGDKPIPGLAARYSRDRGIEKDPDVVMATGFESALWHGDWSYVSPRGSFERVDSAPGLGFEPLVGQALQVKIPVGENLGLDMGYKFADKLGTEPEEIYFRYYLRLAGDWRPSADGGKLPGISATYGNTGWGGRKADGRSGWSMRGIFFRAPDNGSPYHDLTPIGTYAYHADMEDFWGDAWAWSGNGRALLARNRWYCIEQYFKVNQLGRKDGVLRAWIDGSLVYEKTDIRVRDISSIKIEQIWMNVYYGGTTPAPTDLHLFIDNVVIAHKYVGPMLP